MGYRRVKTEGFRDAFRGTGVEAPVYQLCDEIEFLRKALIEAVELLWDVGANKLPQDPETSALADFVAHAPIAWHAAPKDSDSQTENPT